MTTIHWVSTHCITQTSSKFARLSQLVLFYSFFFTSCRSPLTTTTTTGLVSTVLRFGSSALTIRVNGNHGVYSNQPTPLGDLEDYRLDSYDKRHYRLLKWGKLPLLRFTQRHRQQLTLLAKTSVQTLNTTIFKSRNLSLALLFKISTPIEQHWKLKTLQKIMKMSKNWHK